MQTKTSLSELIDRDGVIAFAGSHHRSLKLLLMYRIRKILRLEAGCLPLPIDCSLLAVFLDRKSVV